MRILVVLGNRLQDSGEMSAIMLARLEKALEVYRAGGIDRVIVSGGMPNKKAGKTEAFVMSQYLTAHGVKGSVIIEENNSNTTRGNAKLCAPIIRNLGADSVVLCTSEYHVNRFFNNAEKLFKRKLKKDKNIKMALALSK